MLSDLLSADWPVFCPCYLICFLTCCLPILCKMFLSTALCFLLPTLFWKQNSMLKSYCAFGRNGLWFFQGKKSIASILFFMMIPQGNNSMISMFYDVSSRQDFTVSWRFLEEKLQCFQKAKIQCFLMFPQGKKSLFYDVSSKQQLMKLKERGLSKACVLLSLYTKTHKNWFHSHNNSDNNAAFSQIIKTLVTDLRKCIETRNHGHWNANIAII